MRLAILIAAGIVGATLASCGGSVETQGAGGTGTADAGNGDGGDGGQGPGLDGGGSQGEIRIDVSPVGSGTGHVTSTPAGIDCPGTCTMTVQGGTVVNLVAVPNSGSSFVGWGGGCSGAGPCHFPAAADLTVWVNFSAAQARPRHTLSVTIKGPPAASGRVDSSPAGIGCGTDCSAAFDEGTQVQLTATPSTGSVFAAWAGACSGQGPCVVQMTKDQQVEVDFQVPASDECAGLVPTPGKSATDSRNVGTMLQCRGATTNGNGSTVAFALGSSGRATVHLEPIGGGAEAGTISDVVVSASEAPASEGLLFFPGTAGFQAAVGLGTVEAQVGIATYKETGEETSKYATTVQTAAADPGGGVVALAVDQVDGKPQVSLHRLDEKGAARAPAVLVSSNALQVAVGATAGGWALALYAVQNGDAAPPVFGRWFDGSNVPKGDAFSVGTAAERYVLRPLLDGRLALRSGNRWVAAFRQGAAPSSPPDFLERRPGTVLSSVEGGRAYALTALTPGSGCPDQEIEIVAASGTSCGTIKLAAPSGCTSERPLDIGAGGTVLQTVSAGNGLGVVCTTQWWTGLLH